MGGLEIDREAARRAGLPYAGDFFGWDEQPATPPRDAVSGDGEPS